MNQGFIVSDGIYLEIPSEPFASCNELIPVQSIQEIVNFIFYSRNDHAPLDLFGTLSNRDTFLARAAAKENLEQNTPRINIHEIGPGNFNFATNFVEQSKSLCDLMYTGHDYQKVQFSHVEEEIERNKKIKFNLASIKQFPKIIQEKDFSVYLSEILDDTRTAFFVVNEGIEKTLCTVPQIKNNVNIPSRNKTNRIYYPKEILRFIDDLKMNELLKAHPGFIHHLNYDYLKQSNASLNTLFEFWNLDESENASKFKEKLHKFFKNQVNSAEDGQYLHFPIEGIEFLYNLKNKQDFSLHFFDYGYTNTDYKVSPFSTFNGQITSPVNFGILEHAAKILGYETVLETNREYIKRNLGIDTIPLGYLKRVFNDIREELINKSENSPIPPEFTNSIVKKLKLDDDTIIKEFYDIFKNQIKQSQPGVNCTSDNILSYRVSRGGLDEFLQFTKQFSFLPEKYQIKEGSYHLHVKKN